MPKDQWRTSSRSYREAVRRGQRDGHRPKGKKGKKTGDNRLVHIIPAGTWVLVRKLGDTGRRRSHVTRKEVICVGHLWQNENFWAFASEGWEIMVKVGNFHVGKKGRV